MFFMKKTVILLGIAAIFLFAFVNLVSADDYFECSYGDNFGYCNTPYEARVYLTLDSGNHPYYAPRNEYYSDGYNYPSYYDSYGYNYERGYGSYDYRDYSYDDGHLKYTGYYSYCDDLLGDAWCNAHDKRELNAALSYTFRDYNAWKYNTAGRDSGEVYDTEDYYTESVPASSWRYKEVYNPQVDGNDYYAPRYDYNSGTYNWKY